MSVLDRITDDYGRAVLADGTVTAQALLDRLNAGEGCPFLSLAEGPVGILRALSTRMGPVPQPGQYSLAAVKRVDGKAVMFWWVLNVTPN